MLEKYSALRAESMNAIHHTYSHGERELGTYFARAEDEANQTKAEQLPTGLMSHLGDSFLREPFEADLAALFEPSQPNKLPHPNHAP